MTDQCQNNTHELVEAARKVGAGDAKASTSLAAAFEGKTPEQAAAIMKQMVTCSQKDGGPPLEIHGGGSGDGKGHQKEDMELAIKGAKPDAGGIEPVPPLHIEWHKDHDKLIDESIQVGDGKKFSSIKRHVF
jgi:hypothetical protein